MASTTAFEPLIGLRLARLDGPAPDLLALTLERRGQRHVLLARLRGSRLGLGVVAERPRGTEATPAITRLRHHLKGATLRAVSADGEGRLQFDFERGPARVQLRLAFSTRNGNAELLQESGQIITRLHREAGIHQRRDLRLPATFEALQLQGSELLDAGKEPADTPQRTLILRAVDRRIRGLSRRLQAIAEDAARIDNAAQLRNDANLLLAHMHQLHAATGRVEVTDYSLDPPAPRTLELAAGQTAKSQAQRWYDRARKLERGAEIAAERDALTRSELERLQALRARLQDVPEETLSELLPELRGLGVQGLSADGQQVRMARSRRPYHEFSSVDGHPILVGRGARDNDELTLHVARPHDLFLHVRGCPGSHVIVRLGRDEDVPPETLLDAATLAVHFSPARGESTTEVSHVRKRHVRKPKGAPPGSVVLGQEKVLVLRLEPQRLDRLLATKLAQ